MSGSVRRPLAAALATAQAWLVEPAQRPRAPDLADPPAPRPPRLVVAVFGLARGCGATVVARALGAELAARDVAGAAAVSAGERLGGLPLASQAAGRLAELLAEVPGATTRAVGRLCLVGGAEPLPLADAARHHAPLVLDAGCTAIGGVASSAADRSVLVAPPRLEPALAAVAAAALARTGPEPLLVVGRPPLDDRWHGRANVTLPESRVAAQLALAGREPGGTLGRAIAELADLCEEPA